MRDYPWTVETIRCVNELTPAITGKAFDPDWFLLCQRFEAIEYQLTRALDALEYFGMDLMCTDIQRVIAESGYPQERAK